MHTGHWRSNALTLNATRGEHRRVIAPLFATLIELHMKDLWQKSWNYSAVGQRETYFIISRRKVSPVPSGMMATPGAGCKPSFLMVPRTQAIVPSAHTVQGIKDAICKGTAFWVTLMATHETVGHAPRVGAAQKQVIEMRA